ncbi:hypothetical protein CLD20_19705 [Afifella sp. IM 167]|nr:hypothetical protein [Afifella sp. IM 167]
MGFGFALLRLSPKDFWTMTPRELAAAFGAFSGRSALFGPAGGPLRAGELAALIERFPDQT